MNRKTAVQVPELSGIDLEFRPRDYFWAADVKIPLLSGIGGETRRRLVGELVTGGHPIPPGLDAPVLDEKARQAWGRIHPSNMGGEFLPALRRDEVEIARISLASGHWLFSIPDVRAPPFGPAMLVTQDPQRTRGSQGFYRTGFMNFVPLIGAYFPSAA